jgi:hypothetical protein
MHPLHLSAVQSRGFGGKDRGRTLRRSARYRARRSQRLLEDPHHPDRSNAHQCSARRTVVRVSGAQQSTDGGTSWITLAVPRRTSAAAYTADGTLLSAALTDDRASVSRKTDKGWAALR